MKFAKYLLLLFVVVGFRATNLYAQVGQETRFNRELNTRDDQPVREFVESKENIDVREKASNLEISGDVRFEWRTIQEKGVVFISKRYDESSFPKKFRGLRGNHYIDTRGRPLSYNDFDVEFNFKLKYTYKDAWCFAHVQYDNPAGIRGREDGSCVDSFPIFNSHGDEIEEEVKRSTRFALKGSGEGNLFTLKRAFMGYNIWADGKHRLDIEVGRRKFNDVFDSELEFTSRFDGILLKFASAITKVMDWYIDIAGFVIDERVNHFGYVFEIGIINIYDSGLDLRYNFIDWVKRGRNRCFVLNPRGTKFQNSEITITYTFKHKIFGKDTPIEFYGGFLYNHGAGESIFTKGRRKNLGWYGGVYVGNVHKKGDWSFDIEYIVIQAQAVPEHDVGSISRGNIYNEGLYDVLGDVESNSSYIDSRHSDSYSGMGKFYPRRGNANFIGWRFEGLYGITDNLSLDMIYEFSNEEDRRIGGRHYYQDFEIEAIYAF
jgi:hypothetical protein